MKIDDFFEHNLMSYPPLIMEIDSFMFMCKVKEIKVIESNETSFKLKYIFENPKYNFLKIYDTNTELITRKDFKDG